MAYLHRDAHAGVWCVVDVVVRCVCWVVCFSSLVIFLSCLVFVSVVFSLVSVPCLALHGEVFFYRRRRMESSGFFIIRHCMASST